MASWASIAKAAPAPQPVIPVEEPSKDDPVAVVDANAIINGLRLESIAQKLYTIQEVLDEVRDKQSRSFLASLPYGIQVKEPEEESVKAVLRFARLTGDIQALSAADVKLLALAHTLEVAAHGEKHIRKEPVQVKMQSRHRFKGRALPGWGNVPNPEDWKVIDELEGDGTQGAGSRVNAAATALEPLPAAAGSLPVAPAPPQPPQEGSAGPGPSSQAVQGLTAAFASLQPSSSAAPTANPSPSSAQPVSSAVQPSAPASQQHGDNDSDSDEDGEDDGGWETAAKSRSAARRRKRSEQRHQQRQQVREEEYSQAVQHLRPDAVAAATATAATLAPSAAPAEAQTQQQQQQGQQQQGIAPEDDDEGSDGEGSEVDEGEEGSSGSGEMEEVEVWEEVEGEAEEDEGGSGDEGAEATGAEAAGSEAGGASSSAAQEQWVPNTTSKVAVVTADFPMQNVLLQMGLRLVSRDGLQISRLSRYALRCQACFLVCKTMGRMFCPRCGNMTMERVEVSVGPDGAEFYGVRKKHILRGTRYSLPKPKGGRRAGNPILREDQLLNKFQRKAKKKAEAELLDPLEGEFGGAGRQMPNKGIAMFMASWKHNPNEAKPKRSSRRK